MAIWTEPFDHVKAPYSISEYNSILGANGSVKYLKDACDANAAAILVPMKAQGDGGTVHGGRNKLNFVAGTNMVVTVADDAGNDRINVTLAASGASVPTLGTDKSGVVSFVDPGSYPNWSNWVTLINSLASASLALDISFSGVSGGQSFELGTGSSTVVPKFSVDTIGIINYNKIVPFSIPAGTKLWARAYFVGSSSKTIAVTVLS